MLCSREEEIKHLSLLDFQVSLGFRGNRSDRAVQALRGFLGHQEGQEDQLVPESCCDIQTESG